MRLHAPAVLLFVLAAIGPYGAIPAQPAEQNASPTGEEPEQPEDDELRPSEQVHRHEISRSTLTGGWFGLAPSLEEVGVTVEMVYCADVLANLSGGLRTGVRYLDQLDLMLTLETGPLLGFEHGTFFLMARANHGAKFTRYTVGDLQYVSNIEPLVDDIKLYEAWYEHRFFSERLSLKAGLYDLNSEFDVNETGSVFLHAAHGIGTDFAQSGRNGPSIFPNTGVGARAEVGAAEDLRFRVLVAEGVPRDPENPNRNSLIVRQSEGALLVGEGDWRWRLGGVDGRMLVGAWGYTAAFETVLDEGSGGRPEERRGNAGFYALLEGMLLPEDRRADDGSDQGLGAFLRWGLANDRFNLFGQYAGAGLVYTGPIPGRDRDRLGLAVACGLIGTDSKRAAREAGLDPDRAEVDLELTYRAEVTPWFAVQPDVQYVFRPGAGLTGADDHAFVAGFRVELVF